MAVTGVPTSILSIYSPDVKLDPWQFSSPDQIVEGRPEMAGAVLWQSADKRVGCGIWECTPGIFEWDYTWDETIYAMEGEVRIVDAGGNEFELCPGSVLFIPTGTSATWTVTRQVRKVFHFKSDDAPVEF